MKTLIAAMLISLALALVPPPRITVQNPALLYAAAIYKTAVGKPQSALRLVQRAEDSTQSAAPRASSVTGSLREAISIIL